jgi:SAM-dependent methyltransferase
MSGGVLLWPRERAARFWLPEAARGSSPMTAARNRRPRDLVPETELPDRYQTQWRATFVAQALEHCRPGMTILDAGGGDAPTLPPEIRPPDTTYIGLDPDSNDLSRGHYDVRLLAGASDRQPDLVDRVDLILSWNVLEHVPDMPSALACFHAYLKPGGVLLARFAGRWAVFAIASRLMPHRLRVGLVSRLIGSPAEEHFPTHYNRCTASAFHRMLSDWSEHQIVPNYRGAGYFAFSRPIQRAYLAYESIAMRKPELATHYNVRAVR